MPRPLAVLAVLSALFGMSCIPAELQRCEFADVAGMTGVIDDSCWDSWCFQDLDGDLWAEAVGRPGEDGCSGPVIPSPSETDRVYSFGDCDDGHANRFPGNLEVCDGEDNDCDEETEFNLEDEEEGGLPRCARGRSARLFLAGGSRLAEQDFNAASPTLSVPSGQVLEGVLNLQVVPPEDPRGIAVVAVASWGDRQESLTVLYEGDVTEELLDGEIELEFGELGLVNFTTPQETEDESISVVIAVADLGPVGTAEHLASLTWPQWCCGEVECAEDDLEPCDPVWDDPTVGPAPPPEEPGQLALPNQLDLASLDSLVLASCATLGVARIPLLVTAERLPGAPPEACVDTADPTACQHIYISLVDAGCVEVQMELEGSEE